MALRAVDERDKVLRELEFRMGITTVMLSTLDLEYTLYVILTGITSGDGLGFNRAFLFLDDDTGRELRVRMALGPTSREHADRIWAYIDSGKVNFAELLPRYEAFREDHGAHELTGKMSGFVLALNGLESLAISSQGLILRREASLVEVLARCLTNRVPFSSSSLVLTHEVAPGGGEFVTFENVAIVPLSVGRRLFGAIVADNYFSGREVGSEALRGLHAIGNLAAIAIDRARLYARTLAMAEVDGLTGVYNRRHYNAVLARALEAARRSGLPLSIVVFDLDHFKGFNDRHGHLLGDELLKGVAQIIVEKVRAADVVARYGGEEFVVLLRDTEADAAVGVAEKLRCAVRAAVFGAEKIGGVTLSAGVASTDGKETPEALFARADRALYAAKGAGRDRVCVAPQADGASVAEGR